VEIQRRSSTSSLRRDPFKPASTMAWASSSMGLELHPQAVAASADGGRSAGRSWAAQGEGLGSFLTIFPYFLGVGSSTGGWCNVFSTVKE
jgi:hypothetical protein